MNDTTPEIAEEIRRRLMSLPNATRFIMGAAMFDAARAMVIASLPKDIPAQELRHRLFERIYGKELPSQADLSEAMKIAATRNAAPKGEAGLSLNGRAAAAALSRNGFKETAELPKARTYKQTPSSEFCRSF